jgi:hypothetical protein
MPGFQRVLNGKREMPVIYVAGPIRGYEAEYAYRRIEKSVLDLGFTFQIPAEEERLSDANPRDFHDEIVWRIKTADAVVSVIVTGDGGTPAESVIAAMLDKPQVIVALQGRETVPRIVQGAPGVQDVISKERISDLTDAIESLTYRRPMTAFWSIRAPECAFLVPLD